MVKEAMKDLKHRTDPADVYDFTSNICDQKKYYIYDYPPPEMFEGCTAFVMNWEEEIEKALINRKNNNEVEQQLCFDLTKACIGVNFSEPPRGPEVYVNDEPQHVNSDGTVQDKPKEDL